eukprot:1760138-Rhodomonas_salina.4
MTNCLGIRRVGFHFVVRAPATPSPVLTVRMCYQVNHSKRIRGEGGGSREQPPDKSTAKSNPRNRSLWRNNLYQKCRFLPVFPCSRDRVSYVMSGIEMGSAAAFGYDTIRACSAFFQIQSGVPGYWIGYSASCACYAKQGCSGRAMMRPACAMQCGVPA